VGKKHRRSAPEPTCHFVVIVGRQGIDDHCPAPGRSRTIQGLGEFILCDQHAGEIGAAERRFSGTLDGERWIGLQQRPLGLDDLLP
jgi:hypothetical protein